jgi:cell wall-associated NlpC family hydrolase
MKKKLMIGCLPFVLIGAVFSLIVIMFLGTDSEEEVDCNALPTISANAPVNIDNKSSEENARAVYDFFRSELNATPQGAAGPMGCLDFESGGFNPAIVNPSSGAYGLAQWLGGRKTALAQFAAQKGKEMSNIGVQLEFLKQELENPYYAKAKAALQLTDVHEAQHEWLLWFEGLSQNPEQWHSAERNARADKWFAKFGASDPVSSVALETAAEGQQQSANDNGCPAAAGDILEAARSFLGWFYYKQLHPSPDLGDLNNPNKSGGTDCSGFVWLALNKAGYKVPPNMGWFTGSMTDDARGTKQYLQEIPESEAKAGDVIIVNMGAGVGNDGHTAFLTEDWHGNTTKIIEQGGYGSDSVHEGQVDTSFGYLLAGDICFARPVGAPSTSTAQKGNFSSLNQLNNNAGKVAYGIFYFNNGKYLSNNYNSPMASASVIKVFIMEYLYDKGRINESAGGQSVKNLVEQMITASDNNATNILIDHIGMDTLNQFFKEKGYSNTKLQRKMLASGSENLTSLNDTMSFLKKLYQNRNSEPYSSMLSTMKRQQIKTKIPSKISVPVANKTGELGSVENDIGIVFSDNPFAIVVLTNEVSNSASVRSGIGSLAKEAMK